MIDSDATDYPTTIPSPDMVHLLRARPQWAAVLAGAVIFGVLCLAGFAIICFVPTGATWLSGSLVLWAVGAVAGGGVLSPVLAAAFLSRAYDPVRLAILGRALPGARVWSGLLTRETKLALQRGALQPGSQLRGWSVYIALDVDKVVFWKAAGSTLTRIGVVNRVEVKASSLEQVGIAGSTRTAVRLTLKAEVDGSPAIVDLVANDGRAIIRLGFIAEFDQIIAAWLSPRR